VFPDFRAVYQVTELTARECSASRHPAVANRKRDHPRDRSTLARRPAGPTDPSLCPSNTTFEIVIVRQRFRARRASVAKSTLGLSQVERPSFPALALVVAQRRRATLGELARRAARKEFGLMPICDIPFGRAYPDAPGSLPLRAW